MPVNSEKNSPQQLIEDERNRLSALPHIPYDLDVNRMGVLLSDQIEYYRHKFKLIDPWDQDCLKPAGYDLRVGSNVSIGGKNRELKEFESISIGPYQVAIIETYETLNMPEFLIGRWNIRVALAYDGLLWVGGAQVDPGFRGHLACPIYNLSDKDVVLAFKQPIAMLDFVTTTKINHYSKRFDWKGRKKLIFHQYKPEKLISGITTKIENRLVAFEKETAGDVREVKEQNEKALEKAQNRMDTFVTTILTVISVLFAALGVVATRQPPSSALIAPVCISTLALYLAMRYRSSLPFPKWALVVMGISIIAAAVLFDVRTQRIASDDIKKSLDACGKAANDAQIAVRDAKAQNADLELKLEVLRIQLENLQIDAAPVPQPHPKAR